MTRTSFRQPRKRKHLSWVHFLLPATQLFSNQAPPNPAKISRMPLLHTHTKSRRSRWLCRSQGKLYLLLFASSRRRYGHSRRQWHRWHLHNICRRLGGQCLSPHSASSSRYLGKRLSLRSHQDHTSPQCTQDHDRMGYREGNRVHDWGDWHRRFALCNLGKPLPLRILQNHMSSRCTEDHTQDQIEVEGNHGRGDWDHCFACCWVGRPGH